jgi:hypothetical protein
MLVRNPDNRMNSFQLKKHIENLAFPANKAEIGSKETTNIEFAQNTAKSAKRTIGKVQKSIASNYDSEDEPENKK